MKVLTAPLTTQKDAEQSGWVELYDIYLKASITTPWGTLDTIRICDYSGDFAFFTPKLSPEPTGTQGNAATYKIWPIKRESVKAAAKTQNDKLAVVASNVTAEFAGMLAAVDWYDVFFVIRKVSTTLAGTPTADDCAVIFIGQVDSVRTTLQQVQFTLSNDLGNLQAIVPRENMHQNCRFNWADDQCTALRLLSENYKPKTCGSGSTTTRLKASYAGYTVQAVTADSGTDRITLTSHTLIAGYRVRFGGTTVPGGLTRGTWYFVRDVQTNDFKVAATLGGSAIDLTSNGTAVTLDSETGFTEDLGAAGYIAQAVTADSGTDKVSLTAHGLGNGDRVKFGGTAVPGGLTAGVWYYVVNTAANDFKVALTEGGSAIDLTSNGTSVTIDSTAPYGTDLVDPLVDAAITASSEKAAYSGQAVSFVRTLPNPTFYGQLNNHGLSKNDPIQLGGTTAPTPLSLATTYYFYPLNDFFFELQDAPNGNVIHATSSGTAVTLSTLSDFNAKRVRSSNTNYWRIGTSADWGTLSDGFWQIPDAQAGLANAALKPYIQFDCGSAKTPRIWRIRMPMGVPREELLRCLVFFSSSDAASWAHEQYFELPPTAGQWFDVLMPKASNKRYWRICIRSKWVDLGTFTGFDKVKAFENGRNWWASGLIKFDIATTTVALRGIARKVLASYSGVVDMAALPATPVSGDIFTIERGCPRTFNGCNERRNWENFGGLLDLPNQTVIR